MLAMFGLLLYHGVFSYAATLKPVTEYRHLTIAATIPEAPYSSPTNGGGSTPPVPVAVESAEQVLVEVPKPTTPEPAASERVKVSPRLMIPSIGVNALIEQVALTTEGSMGVPNDPMNAGWYSLGPLPGELGSAVIDGHVNWFNGATGVFRDLHNLTVGDKISTQNDQGEISFFVVKKIKVFDPAADATAVFSSTDGQAHLNLITCGGVWDKQAKQYTERLVVFTDKE